MRSPHILVRMARRTAPRKRLTRDQWQQALAAELRATMARKQILQKDLSRAIGETDPSWISRRLSGSVPIDAATLLVIADYMDEDITAVMTRAKDNATNPCLSHSDNVTPKHTKPHTPPAESATAIRVA
jgi:transcriptional regulator with XRE-family HTH domain